MARSRRRGRLGSRLAVTLNVALVIGLLTAVGSLATIHLRLGEVPRLDLGDSLDEEPDGDSAQNYLLVGTDSAERLDPDDPVTNGREDLTVLSDTIMLLRVDPDSPQAQLLSFPRDLYVEIPGSGEGKINSALGRGGQEALIGTIQQTFDVPVHHYVQVDFLGFQELVRAIDGVPFFFDRPVRDTSTGLFVGHRGCNTLGPEQALAYARSRHLEIRRPDGEWETDPTGDLGRVTRQQEFIRQAITRTISEGLRRPLLLGDVVDVATEAVEMDSDLSVDDFLQLGRKFRTFNDDTLQTMTLDVTDDSVDGSSVLRLQDTEANARRLGVFRGQSGAGADATPDISVVVHNGSGTDGQAGEAAEGLERLGFDTSPGTGDAESSDFDTSVVRYAGDNEAEARFVAAQVEGGAEVEQVDTSIVADVELITGADFEGIESDLQPPPQPLVGGGGGGGGGRIGEVPTVDPPDDRECG